MVGFALQAAEKLAEEGIEAEVIDLRTLRPLDHETVVESVKKTNRLVSVEEGWGPMGVGAEVVARVIEHAFDYLDAPPVRVHQEDVPLPYAANLEALSLPGVDKIVKAVKQVMADDAATHNIRPCRQPDDAERLGRRRHGHGTGPRLVDQQRGAPDHGMRPAIARAAQMMGAMLAELCLELSPTLTASAAGSTQADGARGDLRQGWDRRRHARADAAEQGIGANDRHPDARPVADHGGGRPSPSGT